MKSKQIVLKSICRQIEEPDLIPDSDSRAAVIDLFKRQSCFRQQRFWLDSSRLHPRTGEPRYVPHRGWNRAEVSGVELVQEISPVSDLDGSIPALAPLLVGSVRSED
jgi:hypothetical protein